MENCEVNTLTKSLGIQQTGPRTVIVPADPIQWKDSTSYEYLTLVASEDFGQAYISKRDVPSGTPLTNTKYWVPVASFNAQLADIQRQLTKKADVATVNSIKASLDGEIERSTATDDSIHGDMSKLDEVINGIASTLASKIKVVVCGDSFTAGTVGGVESWASKLPKSRYEVENLAVNGAGFTVRGSGGKTFIEQLDSTTTNNADFVIAYGGYNDRKNGASSIYTAISQFVQAARAKYPKAKVIIALGNIGVTPNYEYTDYFSTLNSTMIGSYGTGAAIISATSWLVPYSTTGFQDDKLHPNSMGQSRIASCFNNILSGCKPQVEMIINPGQSIIDVALTRDAKKVTGKMKFVSIFTGTETLVVMRFTEMKATSEFSAGYYQMEFQSSARTFNCAGTTAYNEIPITCNNPNINGFANINDKSMTFYLGGSSLSTAFSVTFSIPLFHY